MGSTTIPGQLSLTETSGFGHTVGETLSRCCGVRLTKDSYTTLRCPACRRGSVDPDPTIVLNSRAGRR